MDKNRNDYFAVKPVAAVVAIAVAQWAAPVYAQEAQEAQPNPNQLQSVVVTANKRVEKLESVPMAISVISEEELQRNNVREMEDIIALTPSLTQASGTTAEGGGGGIKPVIDMHALLVSVESASEQLVGNGPFRNDSRLASFWTQKNEQLDAIANSTAAAMDIARLDS